MKRKTLFFLLGIVFCSLGTIAQTYKLSEMTEAEYKQGFNSHFRFDQYRLASGVYTPFTIYTDSGRVNCFDRWWPERFQGEFIGGQVNDVAGNRDYTTPLIGAWSAKKTAVDAIVTDNDPTSFIYVARINSDTYETYPTAIGQAAISFIVPSDGYYKITTHVMRMDQMGSGTPEYLMAKFRFRQQGASMVFSSSTLGVDCKYGDMAEAGLETYTALSGVDFAGAERTYTKTKPVLHEFYVYAKTGDMITAESDIAHLYEQGIIADSARYGARAAWGRTRWTQFDAEVVTKEVAEIHENYVNPYEDAGGYVELLQNLVNDCGVYMETVQSGMEVGQYDQADIDAFNSELDEYARIAFKEGLLSFTAKVYYNKLLKAFEDFKAKAYAIDFSLPENAWLFQIPENNLLYADFEKEFDKTAGDSPWDFKSYNVATGVYNALTNFNESNKSGKLAWYDNGNDWFYISKIGTIHPLVTKSPAITFKAAADGLYHASTTIQRDLNNKNKYYMYTRYRFAKGGIQDGVTSVNKESFMFADAYGHADSNVPVSRDFYVKMKAGDVITFEEDAYTANANGNAGSTWQKLMVLKVPSDREQAVIEANKESYFDAYAKASNFQGLDSVIQVIDEKMATVQVTNDPDEIGKYPSVAKLEVDDMLDEAKEIDRSNITQLDVDKWTRDLSAVYAKFLTMLQVRYENEATFASGAYYIEKDGMFVTVDTAFISGDQTVRTYVHLQPLSEITKVKNNQVFDMQFNANSDMQDPLRYTIHCCLKNETWQIDPAYHVTEAGQVRPGDKYVAQSTTGSNYTWRNHSLIYDGTRWAIYNVYQKTSVIIDADLAKKPTTSSNKLYLYRLIPMNEIDQYLSIEEVNGSESNVRIVAVAGEGNAELYGTEAMDAVIYNAAGEPVLHIQLGTSSVKVNLPVGFYIVKAVNNNSITKFIIK